jgi:methylmalonyl-CoA/ethylmalonyl-CoA epimerase
MRSGAQAAAASSSSGPQPQVRTSAPWRRIVATSGSGSRPPPEAALAMSAMRTPRGGYWRATFTLPAMFGRIDHVGLAVTDLEAAIDLHVNVYGLPLVHRETVTEQGVEAALLDVGENHVELLAPLHEETPVGKFLAKRGPGLHHVAYQVEDIEATLRLLRDAGLRLIDESPRTGIRRSQVAFLHPSASGGVLTEIVQPAEVHAHG